MAGDDLEAGDPGVPVAGAPGVPVTEAPGVLVAGAGLEVSWAPGHPTGAKSSASSQRGPGAPPAAGPGS